MQASEIRKKVKISRKNIWGIIFIIPFFLVFAVFWIYPLFNGMYLSLFDWSGLGEKEFVGIDNFKNLFVTSRYYIM